MHKQRYSRNIACIGAEGQERLSAASIFIIGCGALGGQVAMLLAGAGVGRIGIADFDTIDMSNLQRQLFFSEADCGRPKAEVLASRMLSLNSEIRVDVFQKLIRKTDGDDILSCYDYIIDATDNPATKYMTDELCRQIRRPGCIGGVAAWKGQVMCVTGKAEDSSLSFRDLFLPPATENLELPCEVTGVMGAAASTVASIQAAEAIKYIISKDRCHTNRLITIDLLKMELNCYDL